MSKKVYVKTHGCQMNEYDSARMQDLLVDSHFQSALQLLLSHCRDYFLN